MQIVCAVTKADIPAMHWEGTESLENEFFDTSLSPEFELEKTAWYLEQRYNQVVGEASTEGRNF